MKVNVTIADELLKRIDTYSDDNYMTRSGFISLCCTQYLNTAELTNCIKTMSLAMRRIADSGKIDENSMRELEQFNQLAEMFFSAGGASGTGV